MPPVVSGPDAQASTAVQNLLLTARSLLRHASVAAALVDDPGDGVDVVTAFVDHLETFDGAPGCTTGTAVEDRDFDTYPDTYLYPRSARPSASGSSRRRTRPFSRGATTQTFPAILALTLSDAAPPAASLPWSSSSRRADRRQRGNGRHPWPGRDAQPPAPPPGGSSENPSCSSTPAVS